MIYDNQDDNRLKATVADFAISNSEMFKEREEAFKKSMKSFIDMNDHLFVTPATEKVDIDKFNEVLGKFADMNEKLFPSLDDEMKYYQAVDRYVIDNTDKFDVESYYFNYEDALKRFHDICDNLFEVSAVQSQENSFRNAMNRFAAVNENLFSENKTAYRDALNRFLEVNKSLFDNKNEELVDSDTFRNALEGFITMNKNLFPNFSDIHSLDETVDKFVSGYGDLFKNNVRDEIIVVPERKNEVAVRENINENSNGKDKKDKLSELLSKAQRLQAEQAKSKAAAKDAESSALKAQKDASESEEEYAKAMDLFIAYTEAVQEDIEYNNRVAEEERKRQLEFESLKRDNVDNINRMLEVMGPIATNVTPDIDTKLR